MDSSTADFYRHYARNLAASPEARFSAMWPHVERTLFPGAIVLDVGAGSGRDVAAMLGAGFDAFGVEPSADMRNVAFQQQPSLRGRLREASLPHLGHPFSDRLPGGFDALVCSAVLMHVQPDELPQSLDSMAEQLRSPTFRDHAGTAPAMLISLPHLSASRLIGERDAEGRRFHNHDVDRVRQHLATRGLSQAWSEQSRATLATTGTVWTTLVFRRWA